MGVSQSRILSLQCIVFLLLASFSLAQLNVPDIPGGSGACCVPYYAGSLEFITGFTQEAGENYCQDQGALYVEYCYESGELLSSNTANSGCCCNTDFSSSAVSESSDLFVSELWCEEQSTTSQFSYNYIGEQSNCDSACSESLNYYSVWGKVTNSNGGEPLSDILISSNDKSARSDDSGIFTFADEFVEGTYTFDVSILPDQLLDCESDVSITRTVTAFNSDEFYIDLTLDCSESITPIITCEPDWEVYANGEWRDIDSLSDGGWSECIFYGNAQGFLKTRDIQDANNCDDPFPIPDRYTSSGCEEESLAESCDGTYEVGENCDGNIFFYGGQSRDSLSCADVYGSGHTGQMKCTDCVFDSSECESICDCTTLDQCSNECQPICEGEDVCESCQDALRFIPSSAPTGDIFDLYSSIETSDDEGYVDSPIKYQLGTKNVLVEWNYIGDEVCEQDLLGFNVMVCSQDGDTSGSCDTNKNIYVESINGASTMQYLFEDVLEEDSSFCYNVVARTTSGNLPAFEDGNLPAFEDGNLPCYATGSSMCMTPQLQGRNCLYQDGSQDIEGYGPSQCETYAEDDSRVNLQVTGTTCPTGTVCVETAYVPGSNEPQDLGAMCTQAQLCDSCNGMFGLFSDYNLLATAESGDANYRCEELLFSTEEGATVPGVNANSIQYGQCYKEESDTLFSHYEECKEVTSCYDYVSEATCGSDPCFKFTDVTTNGNGVITFINESTGCEWLDIEAELGLGVCRPVEEENQNCEICDTDSPLGFCGKDVCPLYGNCYQKESDNNDPGDAFPAKENRIDQLPACLPVSDMSCALYDTQEECVGDDITNPIEPTIDVLYTQERIGDGIEEWIEPTDRIAGNNQQLTFSNDAFNFGDCSWNPLQNSCFKNSNNYTGELYEDDCDASVGSGTNCFKDNEPPQTTIYLKSGSEEDDSSRPLYGSSEIFNIPFSVEDEHSTPEDITTYVSFLNHYCIDAGYVPCIADGPTSCLSSSSPLEEIEWAYAQGCYIYPQYTLEELQENIDSLNILSENGGLHYLVYFSEDKARNLEELNIVELEIDNSKPSVIISQVTQTPQQLYEDQFVTDVEISLDIYEDSHCQASLQNIGSEEDVLVSPGLMVFSADGASEDSAYAKTLNFLQLDDGIYDFRVSCLDDFENSGDADVRITIDSDTSITPLSPLGAVFIDPSSILLEISTANDGYCRYDTTTHTYENSRGFFSSSDFEDGRYVYRTPYDYETFGDASGIYRLLVSCDFGYDEQGEELITENKPGDLLLFGIDTISPQGNVYDEQGENYTGSTNSWKNSRQLELTCDDANADTPFGFNQGCSTIHYCISKQASLNVFNQDDSASICKDQGNGVYNIISSSNDEDETLSTTIDLDLTYEYAYIHYFFEDRGGSRSDVYTINPKIRDTEISEPFVEIG